MKRPKEGMIRTHSEDVQLQKKMEERQQFLSARRAERDEREKKEKAYHASLWIFAAAANTVRLDYWHLARHFTHLIRYFHCRWRRLQWLCCSYGRDTTLRPTIRNFISTIGFPCRYFSCTAVVLRMRYMTRHLERQEQGTPRPWPGCTPLPFFLLSFCSWNAGKFFPTSCHLVLGPLTPAAATAAALQAGTIDVAFPAHSRRTYVPAGRLRALRLVCTHRLDGATPPLPPRIPDPATLWPGRRNARWRAHPPGQSPIHLVACGCALLKLCGPTVLHRILLVKVLRRQQRCRRAVAANSSLARMCNRRRAEEKRSQK